MNIKIQGGGNGAYANTGSCIAVTNYLGHEDLEQLKQGMHPEPFFNGERAGISPREVTYKVDNNRARLCNKDAKFFVITVSPSQKEIKSMGNTLQERSENFKKYINDTIMERYAENFGKGLQAKNLMYYAKIHHERENKEGEQMHAHIIVSRKDITNNMKLSPQTNHRSNGRTGTAKGSFDRSAFYEKCEISFDERFKHKREFEETFAFQNTMKNGKIEEIAQLPKKRNLHESKLNEIQQIQEFKEQEQIKLKGISR